MGPSNLKSRRAGAGGGALVPPGSAPAAGGAAPHPSDDDVGRATGGSLPPVPSATGASASVSASASASSVAAAPSFCPLDALASVAMAHIVKEEEASPQGPTRDPSTVDLSLPVVAPSAPEIASAAAAAVPPSPTPSPVPTGKKKARAGGRARAARAGRGTSPKASSSGGRQASPDRRASASSASSSSSTSSSSATEYACAGDARDPINRNDVLCGRGGLSNHHSGNVYFRDLVKDRQEAYLKASKRDKAAVAREIVDRIKSQIPPGRFLKRDHTLNGWIEVPDRKAREKTSQALREGAPDLKAELIRQDPALRKVFDEVAPSLPGGGPAAAPATPTKPQASSPRAVTADGGGGQPAPSVVSDDLSLSPGAVSSASSDDGSGSGGGSPKNKRKNFDDRWGTGSGGSDRSLMSIKFKKLSSR